MGGSNFLLRYFKTPLCPLFLQCLSMPTELSRTFPRMADYLYEPRLGLAKEALILSLTSRVEGHCGQN